MADAGRFPISQAITTIIAVYGAALSTYNALLSWNTNRRHVKVEVSWGFIVSGVGESSSNMLFIKAMNPGHKTVTLQSVGFRLPDARLAVIPVPLGEIRLPHQLEPGTSCQVWVDPLDLKQRLGKSGFSGSIKIKGFFGDAVGKSFFAEPIDFDVDKPC